MCGIAGIISLNHTAPDPAIVRRMCDRLVHRGPDDEGYHVRGPVALGQRRLSIIDLPLGKQPLANEDGTVWVTFNGEIYNFQELRRQLEQAGHRFRTRSDTEVIVHAYEEFGAACVEHFRGMFAFALWDERRRTLLLARDRVGKKPLFYAQIADAFVFASELQGLLAHPAVPREVDPAAVDDYLTYGYVPAPETIFRGIYKLLPGHTLTFNIAPESGLAPALHEAPYWKLHYGPKLVLSEEEAADQLLELLTEAVRLRLVADVPLGALLSGGIDSSIVVALMARLSSRPVQTFSIGFAEQDFNELPFARRVAEHCGTEHHELIVEARAVDVLPVLVRHYGEPFADSSAVPSYYVSRLTHQHVTVALNGDGGDESFAGYERYLGARLARRLQALPRWVRAGMGRTAACLIPDALPRRSRLRQARRFLEAASLTPAQRYLRWMCLFTPQQKADLYSSEYREVVGDHQMQGWLPSLLEDDSNGAVDLVDRLLSADVRSYLPYDLLVKMDIAAMANSLETRSPFLDHQVMAFAARLPAQYKIQGTTLKYLLKQIGRRILPPEVLNRRKMGFGVPVSRWLREELRPLLEDVLLAPQARLCTYLNRVTLARLVRDHGAGTQDHSFQLWALLWLELWHREFEG
jgi:asparagine synthase (glutamine-hydrolysing)